ncbi:uncharacterized protein Dwil_GK12511 [Drosophila willistoni]|uniref:Uncharacterized protein n=1 Tax=Drosophila willistoni TaxID=7260 RepID=B4N371_DROWI|nr:uncharacterized protein LOC6645058 [Drosophila willistoni]EDW78810.1 uncharacterized protein Dwil_GK12511 [Drosophila willistoni]
MEKLRSFFFKAKPMQDDLGMPQEDQQTEDVITQKQDMEQQFYNVEQGSDSNTLADNEEGKPNDIIKIAAGVVGEKDIFGSSRQVPDGQTQTQTEVQIPPSVTSPSPPTMEIPDAQLKIESEIEMPLPNAKVPKYREEQPVLIDYNKEFVKFIDQHTPKGFSQKLEEMVPYLGASFISWPTYWLYRGIHWQQKRNTERIGLYIQRTFQHAKMLQLVILATGLLMATTAGRSSSGLLIHEVSNKGSQIQNDN